MESVYVGNLSYDATEEDLKTLFSSVGVVTKVSIIKDRETGRPKGFAFVEMSSGANEAISQINGRELLGRQMKVNMARPKESRPYSPSSASSGGGMPSSHTMRRDYDADTRGTGDRGRRDFDRGSHRRRDRNDDWR